jgi:hypothetical protein
MLIGNRLRMACWPIAAPFLAQAAAQEYPAKSIRMSCSPSAGGDLL